MFEDLCLLPVEDDGLVFDASSVSVKEIREDAHYSGVRVTLRAKLANVRIPVQVDIGYGDAVFPEPETIVFPALLDFPAPTLKAYPVYTVVAEKLEAMVVLGDGDHRYLSEGLRQVLLFRIPKTKQIQIVSGPMGLLIPDDKQHRSFQQESISIHGLSQPEEQALDSIPHHDQVEHLASLDCHVHQTSLHRGRQVLGGCHVSISR